METSINGKNKNGNSIMLTPLINKINNNDTISKSIINESKQQQTNTTRHIHNISNISNISINSDNNEPNFTPNTNYPEESNNQMTELIYQARIYSLLSHLIFVISDLFMKYFTEKYHDKALLVFSFYRSLSAFFYMYLHMKVYNIPIIDITFFGKNQRIRYFNIIRNLLNPIIFILLTYSMSQIKLGLVSTLFMTYPIFQALQGPYITYEKVNKNYYIACGVSLLGVYLISSSDNSKTYSDGYEANIYLGYFSILCCSFLTGLFFNINKVVIEEIDAYNMNLSINLFSSVLFIIIIVVGNLGNLSEVWETLTDLKLIFYSSFNGLFSTLALYLISKSTEFVDPSKSSYLAYIEMPLLCILGYLFFGEVLGFIQILGSVMIVLTIFFVSYYIN